MSNMKWIKASERLPDVGTAKFIKVWEIENQSDEFSFMAIGNFTHDEKKQPLFYYFNASAGKVYPFVQRIEWLDESNITETEKLIDRLLNKPSPQSEQQIKEWKYGIIANVIIKSKEEFKKSDSPYMYDSLRNAAQWGANLLLPEIQKRDEEIAEFKKALSNDDYISIKTRLLEDVIKKQKEEIFSLEVRLNSLGSLIKAEQIQYENKIHQLNQTIEQQKEKIKELQFLLENYQ